MSGPNSQSAMHRCKFAGLFAACALFAHYFAVTRVQVAPYYPPASLPQLLAGHVPGPFQYRALFLWVIAAIRHQGWFVSPTHGLRELCYLFEFFFTYALFAVTWMYLGLFIRSDRIKAVGLLLLMYVLCMTYLVPMYFAYYYVSDVPAVFFFTLGLYLIRRDRMLPFYLLYTVATLNRETFAFLTVAYALVNWERPRRRVCVSCAIQVLIWITVKSCLAFVYGVRPLFQSTLFENLAALPAPFTFFQVLSALGLLWIFPALGWRRISDLFLKRACLVLPLFGVVALCTANVDELRVYGELTPIVLPPALLAMQRLFQEAGPQVSA